MILFNYSCTVCNSILSRLKAVSAVKLGSRITATVISRYHSSLFITTPIFYVNGPPHIGHFYTALIADATFRFHKLTHPEQSAIFSTGTDEHGIKIEKAASTAGVPVKEYCDKISAEYVKLFEVGGVEYTHFIRTTDQNHIEAVQNFWNLLSSKGFIYEGSYQGWYCVPDETFLFNDQLEVVEQDGKEVRISRESGHVCEWTEEQNCMFKLSSLRDDLLYWLNDETRIVPYKFYKILRDMASNENVTKDISVSRPKKRMSWGIPVPGNENQTIYVWLDALVSYLTVVGYPDIQTWPPDVQICGKDILKFHGIYWPAFLIAAGLEPPKKLFVHSHWTVDNIKMSKSKNNVVNPFEKMETYSVSGLRYFLLRDGVPHSDGNYSLQGIVNLGNAELGNSLGNLLNRCTGKVLNPSQHYPAFARLYFNAQLRGSDTLVTLAQHLSNLGDVVGKHYSEMYFYRGIDEVATVLRLANKYFECAKPWELKKVDDPRVLHCVLHITMESLRICGIALLPVIPEMAEKLLDKLGVPKGSRTWKHIKPTWDQYGDTSDKSLPLSPENVILYKKAPKLPPREITPNDERTQWRRPVEEIENTKLNDAKEVHGEVGG